MNKNIKVSIILPTWNGSKYIKIAIESILSQNFTDWELIIVDDCSEDNTENTIREYLKNESRIIYIKNKVNLGIQKTLNIGLAMAVGQYIARIDDDDEWIDKDKLKQQVEFLDKNSNYVLVGTRAIYVDEEGNKLRKYLSPETDEQIREDLLSRNCFFHSSVLFKKDIALELGGYDEKIEIKHVEDQDLWLKMGLKGKFYILPIFAIKYKIRDNNITSNHITDLYKGSIMLASKYRDNYPNYFISLIRGCARLVIYGYIFRMPIYVLVNKIKRIKFFNQNS